MATVGSELGGPRAIVAVNVTNIGSDMGAITPMLDQIERRTGKLPETLLADANHGGHEAIVEWKRRMETDEANRLYRARASLCECINAHVADRFGLRLFLVRGLDKTMSVALLIAITSNLLQHLTTLGG